MYGDLRGSVVVLISVVLFSRHLVLFLFSVLCRLEQSMSWVLSWRLEQSMSSVLFWRLEPILSSVLSWRQEKSLSSVLSWRLVQSSILSSVSSLSVAGLFTVTKKELPPRSATICRLKEEEEAARRPLPPEAWWWWW